MLLVVCGQNLGRHIGHQTGKPNLQNIRACVIIVRCLKQRRSFQFKRRISWQRERVSVCVTPASHRRGFGVTGTGRDARISGPYFAVASTAAVFADKVRPFCQLFFLFCETPQLFVQFWFHQHLATPLKTNIKCGTVVKCTPKEKKIRTSRVIFSILISFETSHGCVAQSKRSREFGATLLTRVRFPRETIFSQNMPRHRS